jgi:acetylornithine deacetylase
MTSTEQYARRAEEFLRRMVRIKAFSTEEQMRSFFVFDYLTANRAFPERIGLNVTARTGSAANSKPTVVLDAHLDTVLPSDQYTFDPLDPPYDERKIFGLGSNDDGGSVAAMIHTFLYFIENKSELSQLAVNLMLSLTVEEEKVGANGIMKVRDHMDGVKFAIVGEPTGMKAAIGERGLLVVDALSEGVSGHAAREEGVNALYVAMDDIQKVRSFKFDKVSKNMGDVKMTVTQINAGTQHNVVPDKCSWVIDIRPTDAYTPAEIMGILQGSLKSTLTARSLEHNSSATPEGHPVFGALEKLGIETYVSPTTSDWTRLQMPAIKMGPGESSRSHKADEYVTVSELSSAIDTYIELLKNIRI